MPFAPMSTLSRLRDWFTAARRRNPWIEILLNRV
jgi:hypothetical protein